jgi:hypothetical protein
MSDFLCYIQTIIIIYTRNDEHRTRTGLLVLVLVLEYAAKRRKRGNEVKLGKAQQNDKVTADYKVTKKYLIERLCSEQWSVPNGMEGECAMTKPGLPRAPREPSVEFRWLWSGVPGCYRTYVIYQRYRDG